MGASCGVVTRGAICVYGTRATLWGAFAGSSVGGVSAFIGYFVEKNVLEYTYSPQWLADTYLGYAVFAVLLGLVVFVVVSLATPRPSEAKLAAIAAQPVDDSEEFFRGVAETG